MDRRGRCAAGGSRYPLQHARVRITIIGDATLPGAFLLDELPPYFAYAKSVAIGNSDLSVVTTAALANLLIAVADNPEARAAQAAIDANIVIPPTNAEKNRADIDYLAVMLGVEL